ncbi:hypothetical protein BDN72DRAFT_383868 [Pluteus cervinus]|uniref:Uncharacterized protein n=1 Tax=Pluteus cervinus TaxID=181527 RepID=A0ACD3A9N8_9AGAR|nr:hypothetical protein BDN72DRAFT_383868 [Pluteus cervinus]
MCLLTCPPDILSRVFTHLDGYSLMRCGEICRRLNEIISTDIYAQYSLALYRSGMIDDPGDHSSVAVVDRLNQLRSFLSRRSSWNEAGPTLAIRVPDSSSTRSHLSWEYSAGLFVSLPTKHSAHSLDFIASTPTTTSEVEVDLAGIAQTTTYTEHRVDRHQDLLVYGMMKRIGAGRETSGFHLLSLSNGQPHPEAAFPYHPLPYNIGMFSSLHFEIYEDFVLVCDSIDGSYWGDDIYVYNWKTGAVVSPLTPFSQHIKDVPDLGFTFLDRDHLIGCSNRTSKPLQLQIFSLKTSSCILVLPFPELVYSHRDIDHEAFNGVSKPSFSPRQNDRRRPFRTSPDSAIMSVEIQDSDRDLNKWCFVCVFPKSAIFELLTTTDTLSKVPRVVEWGSWPQTTFELPSPSSTGSHGSRLVTILPNSDLVQIFDFHPRWFTRVMKPVEKGHVFTESIMTIPPPQPSQEIPLELNGGHWNLYVDEDLLVVGSFREGDGNHYVFKA